MSAPAAAADDGDGPVQELVAGLVFALGAMAVLWTFRPSRSRRRDAREKDASEPADGGGSAPEPAAGGRRPQPPLLNAVAMRLADSAGATADAPTPRAVPRHPGSAWTAEIRWVEAESGARFAAFARTGEQEDATVVAESPALEWPPTGPAAVQALSDAVDELERTLLAAGWTALPAGSEWYAKRFAWKSDVVAVPQASPPPAPAPQEQEQAQPAAPDPPPEQAQAVAPDRPPEQARSGRFRRRPAWPEGSEQMWRCELRWGSGLVSSRFEAIAYGPGERQGSPIAGSATFKWLMGADPDPAAKEYQAELGRLVAALRAAGWDDSGRGAKWYSARFVWRRTGSPPDRIEQQPQLAGQAAAGAARSPEAELTCRHEPEGGVMDERAARPAVARWSRASVLRGALGGAAAIGGGVALGRRGGAAPLAAPSTDTDAEILSVLPAARAGAGGVLPARRSSARGSTGSCCAFATHRRARRRASTSRYLTERLGGRAPAPPQTDFGDCPERSRRASATRRSSSRRRRSPPTSGRARTSPAMRSPDVVPLVSVEARQVAWVRDLAGVSPAPRAADPPRDARGRPRRAARAGVHRMTELTLAAVDRDEALRRGDRGAVRHDARRVPAHRRARRRGDAVGARRAARAAARVSDVDILRFGLRFERLQATFYTQAEELGTIGRMADAKQALGAHARRARARAREDHQGRCSGPKARGPRRRSTSATRTRPTPRSPARRSRWRT